MFLICGEALYDLFVEEETPTGLRIDARIGGSPFNVAVGLARLGQTAALLTGVSTDALGDRLVAALVAEGVETRFLARMANPTTLAVVALGPAGEPRFTFYGDRAADRSLTREDLPRLPDDVSCLHFGSFSLVVEPTAGTLLELAERERGRRFISLDLNVRTNIEPDLARWDDAISRFARTADLVKLSEEDLGHLDPAGSPDRLAETWLNDGARASSSSPGERTAHVCGPGRAGSCIRASPPRSWTPWERETPSRPRSFADLPRAGTSRDGAARRARSTANAKPSACSRSRATRRPGAARDAVRTSRAERIFRAGSRRRRQAACGGRQRVTGAVSRAWRAVEREGERLRALSLRTLFERDPERFSAFSFGYEDLLVDLSKEKIDHPALDALLSLAEAVDLPARREALFAGERVNTTEERAALHMSLRGGTDESLTVEGIDVTGDAATNRERFLAFAEHVRAGRHPAKLDGKPFTDVVHIGIGGSHLGPEMAVRALRPDHDGPCIHFVSNVDGSGPRRHHRPTRPVAHPRPRRLQDVHDARVHDERRVRAAVARSLPGGSAPPTTWPRSPPTSRRRPPSASARTGCSGSGTG